MVQILTLNVLFAVDPLISRDTNSSRFSAFIGELRRMEESD